MGNPVSVKPFKGPRFWEQKKLTELSREEWESLCDGCAKCCLFKVEDEDDGKLYATNVVCRYLDTEKCQCTCYSERSVKVPECVTLSSHNLSDVYYMPNTCAYRLLAEGKPLPEWHPLVSCDSESMHAAGQSVQGKVVSEDDADDLMMHLTGEWD